MIKDNCWGGMNFEISTAWLREASGTRIFQVLVEEPDFGGWNHENYETCIEGLFFGWLGWRDDPEISQMSADFLGRFLRSAW